MEILLLNPTGWNSPHLHTERYLRVIPNGLLLGVTISNQEQRPANRKHEHRYYQSRGQENVDSKTTSILKQK